MAMKATHWEVRARTVVPLGGRALQDRYWGRKRWVSLGCVVRKTTRDFGSERKDSVVVVTGTLNRAMRNRQPNSASMNLAQGRGRNFFDSSLKETYPATGLIRGYSGGAWNVYSSLQRT